MIIDIFKKSYIHQAAFLLLASLALWANTLFFGGWVSVESEPYSLFYGFLGSFALAHPLAAVIIAFFLTIAEGFYLNHIFFEVLQ